MKEKILERLLVNIFEASEACLEESMQDKAECLCYINGLAEMCNIVFEIMEGDE